MPWTALLRSSREFRPTMVWLFPDAGYDAPQQSALCGELLHRRQTVRPSEPQSGLQPDLSDLAALLRKTVFLHETNKRQVPFSALACLHIDRGFIRLNVTSADHFSPHCRDHRDQQFA